MCPYAGKHMFNAFMSFFLSVGTIIAALGKPGHRYVPNRKFCCKNQVKARLTR